MTTPAHSPQEFKLLPQAFTRMRRRIAIRMWVILGIGYSALASFAVFQLFYKGRTDNLGLFALFALSFAIMGIFQYRTANRSVKRMFETFRIQLFPDAVVRHMGDLPALHISKDQVIRIQANQRGDIVLRTSITQHFIVIPRDIEGYDTIAASLKAWIAWEQLKSRGALGKLYLVIFAAAFFVCLFSPIPWLTIVLAPPLIGVLLWSVIQIQRSPNVESRIKLLSWMVIFPLFSLVGELIIAILRVLHILR